MKKYRVLKNRLGRTLKVGDNVQYCGDRCYIYEISGDGVGLERYCDGISWLVDPAYFGGYWDGNL